jgi:hypothetical protein
MDRRSPGDVIRMLVTGAAIVIAVILTIGAVAAIGAYVFIVIAMSNYGSNK